MTPVESRAMKVPALLIAFIVGLLVHAAPAPAEAGKVEKKFGGKILLSDKKFPQSAKSESQYISKLNKQKKFKFWEDKANQQWKVHYAAFFRKPLKDLEYTIRISDPSTGKVAAFEQYTDSSDQSSLLSYIIVERKQFGVNKKLKLEIVSQGRVVASGEFQILGEAEKFTGKADFSEEEASGGGSE
jgi:hypothetical protein